MKAAFDKPYTPSEHEDRMYDLWEQSGFFNPDVCIKKGITKKDAEPFSIVLPPPNVTGVLHMGHAAMLAVEDILVRYHRMRGYKTLWLPGTDSAAIATQTKVESILYKESKQTRHDLGREAFLKRVHDFALKSQGTILNQLRKMGSSLDWSRLAYTLDKPRYKATLEAFVRMYEAGLIYRGARIVNWDPAMQTTVSDEEIERKEEKGTFYYLKYGPFTIGTARPETKFGDKYVVMHPDDTRYEKYEHGQKIELEWINGPVVATVIKDEAVDRDFGTGVMTITPWHDAVDFEIAERHKLDKEQIIDWRGLLLPTAGEFAGEHIKKARPKIIEKLRGKELLERVDENYTHNVAINSRGGGIIEPQIKEQWFVDVDKEFTLLHSEIKGISSGSKTTLKEVLRASVKNKQIKILPEHFEKTYFHWIDNLRPWCISRQIWYGHRIPVWYHENKCVPIPGREEEISQCKMMIVSIEEPKCKHCNAKYLQDPDTLDTWFSSGLWTFSTLGWPEQTSDLKTYHPTSVLETGYDILFFWVARMILMSGFHMGTIPFHTAYLHGLVRDEKKQKMSKSLGNIIDPLDMIEKFGADATRLSLVVGAAPGGDLPLSEDKIRGYKHFANKLWNITRFVLMNTSDFEFGDERPSLRKEDETYLKELDKVAKRISSHINEFRLDLAADTLYHFAWDRFAAEILEETKAVLKDGGPDDKASVKYMLSYSLVTLLKLLHPFMPFVTETIWQELPKEMKASNGNHDLLMVSSWPK